MDGCYLAKNHPMSEALTAGIGWEEGRALGVSIRCSPPACPHRGRGLPREKLLLTLSLRIRVVDRFTQALSLVVLFNYCCYFGSAGSPLLRTGFSGGGERGLPLVTELRTLATVASPAVEPGSRRAGSATASLGLDAPWSVGSS